MKSLSRARLFATPWIVACTKLLCPWDFSRQEVLEWVAISFARKSSQPRDRTQVSHIVDRRFTIWATREEKFFFQPLFFFWWAGGGGGKNPGVGCHSFLQEIFPTQGLKPGLLYCRQMLYQLSYWESPFGLLRPSPDWVSFTHIMEDNLAYSSLLIQMLIISKNRLHGNI